MKKLGFVLIILAGLAACQSGGDNKKQHTMTPPDPQERKELNIPAFNADSAYSFIEEQVTLGPRVPNTDGHQKGRDYLVGKLEQYTDKVYVQDISADRYDGVSMKGYNIIGAFNPESSRRILLRSEEHTSELQSRG